MLNEELRTLITTTGELLGLEDLVIEKDYYVTQIIHALSEVENDYFRGQSYRKQRCQTI